MPIQKQPSRSSVRIHQRLCCLLGAIVLAGCGGPTITATSLLRVNLENGQSDEDNSYETYKQTQAELVTTQFVLRAAMRPPHMQQLSTLKELPKPVEWLEKHIKTKYQGNSEILSVSLQCQDADEAKVIVDAVVEAYLDEALQAERNNNAERLELLRSTYRQTIRDLQEILADTNRIGNKVGLPGSSLGNKTNHELEMEEIKNQSHQLATLRSEMLAAKIDLKVYQKLVADQTGPAADATNVKIKESTARHEVLKAEFEKQNGEFMLASKSLRNRAAFSAEYETKKLKADILREHIMSLSQQINDMEMKIQTKPRVQLVQTADTDDS